ncbi:alpha/beta fold hydrolase [Nocardia sp. SYP-A9097]|uniref:alpha/beta hydrolase n=1 Tax=Nocardia sp. SYP-A9097 TaxID=2663237 RepID=UPI00129A2484|nr:alpha/beta hydrolase [Nocardia sp. SYP-A9097]MRH89890.1 alpha/beta fold hydrolase [Nocardia sp. SYP-A9097]
MRHPAETILNALTYVPGDRRIYATPEHFGVGFEDLSLRTADGETVNAWFVRAVGKPLGHILFAHGNGGNIGDRSPVLALLAASGFDVLIFDYRGYGSSSGRPSERGTYLDARAAREALLAQSDIDPKQVVYLGKSLGGGVMLELANAFPPAALILMSTFTGLRDAAKVVYPLLPKVFVPNAYPSSKRIRGLRCPVLIMHGDTDELLPVRMGRELFAAAPEPKELVIYPGGAHNDIVLIPGWANTVADWVAKVIPSTR